ACGYLGELNYFHREGTGLSRLGGNTRPNTWRVIFANTSISSQLRNSSAQNQINPLEILRFPGRFHHSAQTLPVRNSVPPFNPKDIIILVPFPIRNTWRFLESPLNHRYRR